MIVTPGTEECSPGPMPLVSFHGVDFVLDNSSFCDLDITASNFPQYQKEILDVCATSPSPLMRLGLQSDKVLCVLTCTISRHCQEILGKGNKHEFCVNLSKLFESNRALPCNIRVGCPASSQRHGPMKFGAQRISEYTGVMYAVGSDTALIVMHSSDSSGKRADTRPILAQDQSSPVGPVDGTPGASSGVDGAVAVVLSGGNAGGSGGIVRQRSLVRRRVSTSETTGGVVGSGNSRSAWLRARSPAGLIAVPSSPLTEEQTYRHQDDRSTDSPAFAPAIRDKGSMGSTQASSPDLQRLGGSGPRETSPAQTSHILTSPCGDSGSRTIFADLLMEPSCAGKADVSPPGGIDGQALAPRRWGLFSSVMQAVGLSIDQVSRPSVYAPTAAIAPQPVSAGEPEQEGADESRGIYCSPPDSSSGGSVDIAEGTSATSTADLAEESTESGTSSIAANMSWMDGAVRRLQESFLGACQEKSGSVSAESVRAIVSCVFLRETPPLDTAASLFRRGSSNSMPTIFLTELGPLLRNHIGRPGVELQTDRSSIETGSSGVLFCTAALCMLCVAGHLRSVSEHIQGKQKQKAKKEKKRDKYFGLGKTACRALQRAVTTLQYCLAKGEVSPVEVEGLRRSLSDPSGAAEGGTLGAAEAAWLLLQTEGNLVEAESSFVSFARRGACSVSPVIDGSSRPPQWTGREDIRGSRMKRFVSLMRAQYSARARGLFSLLFDEEDWMEEQAVMGAPNPTREELPRRIICIDSQGAKKGGDADPEKAKRRELFPVTAALRPLHVNTLLAAQEGRGIEGDGGASVGGIVSGDSPRQLQTSPTLGKPGKPANSLLSIGGERSRHIGHRSDMVGRLKKQHTSTIGGQASGTISTDGSTHMPKRAHSRSAAPPAASTSVTRGGQIRRGKGGRSSATSSRGNLRPPVCGAPPPSSENRAAVRTTASLGPSSSSFLSRGLGVAGGVAGGVGALFDMPPRAKRVHSLDLDFGAGPSSYGMVETPIRKKSRGGGVIEDTPQR